MSNHVRRGLQVQKKRLVKCKLVTGFANAVTPFLKNLFAFSIIGGFIKSY